MGILEMTGTAIGALRAHKLRTALSILGIVIGVAAVVAIIAIVNGATASMMARISGLGMRTITITIFPQALASAASAQVLTEELTAKLAAAPDVSQVVPTTEGRGQAVIEGKSWNVTLLGVTPEYMTLFDAFYPEKGRFIHPLDDGRAVAVLGADVTQDLFGEEDPLGESLLVEVWGQKVSLRVIGVMAPRGTVGRQDLDAQIYLPLSTAQRLSGSRQFTSYIAQAASDEAIEQAASEIEAILAETLTSPNQNQQAQGGPGFFGRTRSPYNVQIQKEMIETYQGSVQTMMLILGGVGAISLLVGGIGIMNIMLVSVTERTREIGIRMAIGARPKDIRAQFLVEAVLICSIGGLLGLGLGWLCGWLGSLFGDWPFVISIYPALLACGFSLAIGLTFGLYPALRAARLDPVEALRYE